MHREIGMLTAKVDIILEGVRRSEEKADISRASMHRRMDEIVDRVSKVETATVSFKEDIDEMKPTVDDVKIWRQRGIGALAIVGVGASAITFIVTKFGTAVLAWATSR
ncbi:DUF1515 domain-containing protein [Rhizobium ruizarguesonis]|jgi:hypothetical protein|uniref:DUF1515 family protein n=1 Tax=Rhizobium TaxID=379 RepID=UPI0010306369|nr:MULTISPECIES: DUF1515 family protein [Rhizobium]TBB28112.1 DUF1515 domain-containing protein [Rhizobium ruizarguesonis]TBB49729.1 DUF1515 domain-containing protein [Rhizobium ruizarguesonis]TBE54486.1 DUF1515 domain-containing protein [Rhizobium leguminosarum]WSG87315.1 DUF1515 family protein [Rhizobium beringeri]WSH59842.1 DUF1515 family protein [Rhizobium ruizarguesonis]